MINLRRTAVSVHLWLGLTVGILGMFLALTGGWILFRPQADAAVNAQYLTVKSQCRTPISLDRLITAATAAYPRSGVDSLWLKADPSASVMIRYNDDEQSYFDPCTAKLLGFHGRWNGTFGFIEYLHRFRFLPVAVAEPITGSIAVIMAFFLGIVGLYIWWPRRFAAWKRSLIFDQMLKGRAKTRNRHSVIGAVASLGLIVVAGSGVPLAFDSVEALLFSATGTKPLEKPEVAHLERDAPLAMQTAWDNARKMATRPPREASLRLPTPKRASIEMYIYDQGNPNLEGRTYAYADPQSGKIVRYTPYADTPLGQRLYSWLMALHEGEVGGLPGQLLTFAAMLATLYLGYSGVRGYVQRNNGRPRRMKVAAIRDEALGIKAFDLVPVDGKRLGAFAAGAHIDVHVPNGPKRQFSLCNGPDQRETFTIAVRLEADSRGGSRGMHALGIDQEILVGAPRNHFPLVKGTKHAVLIAAGIGVTPMICIARHLAKRRIPFDFHYFGRSIETMAYVAAVTDPAFGGKTTVHVGLSRNDIAATLLDALGAHFPGRHAYMCGPNGFMDSVDEAAAIRAWPVGTVHRENFSPPASALSGPRHTIEVMLARSKRNILVSEDQTVLEALLDAGLPVAHSCERGTCGDCAVRVVSGCIDHRDTYLSDGQKRSGNVMLPCISRAKAETLALDL